MTNINRDIFCYITKLNEDISDEVFNCENCESLGKYYFNRILSCISGSTEDDIINVLNILAKRQGKQLNASGSIYSLLCETIGLKHIPQKILLKVNNLYKDTFENRYHEIEKKYNAALADIKQSNSVINNTIDTIGNSMHKIMTDITNDFEALRKWYRELNELRTKESVLEDCFRYLKDKLNEYGDLTNESVIAEKNRKIAITYSFKPFSNEKVEDQFTVYTHFLSSCEYVIENYDDLFFDIKTMPFLKLAYKDVLSLSCAAEEKEKRFREMEKTIYNEKSILKETKQRDLIQYNNRLTEYINNYNIINAISEYIQKLVCICKRKTVLNLLLELYNKKHYMLIINMLPIQIEGVISDLQDDVNSFDRFSHCKIIPSADLQQKIHQLQNSIPFNAAVYFKHYFNNIIRNTIAHGRAVGESDSTNNEIFAKELILDFHTLLYLVSRYSDAERMYRFVNGYINRFSILSSSQDICYQSLLNDLIGQKSIINYDSVEHYPPFKVVYWILNPYYENLYYLKANKDDTSLIDLRKLLLDKDFWTFVKKKVQDYCEWGCYKENLKELLSIINGLFSCNPSDETKSIMKGIHNYLKKQYY